MDDHPAGRIDQAVAFGGTENVFVKLDRSRSVVHGDGRAELRIGENTHGLLDLPHGMQTDGVALGVRDDGDVPVFADGHFLFVNRASIGFRAGGFHRAVLA